MARLIDADALKEKFAKTQTYIKDGECAEAFYAHGNNLSTEWDCVEDIVESMPTIEERKGKWILTRRNGILCGVCHSGFRRMPTLEGKPIFIYCPLCGAKMEGSEEE
jgi:hypothetical protein